MSRNIFDAIAPFHGRHNPLRNGWSTEQLRIVAQALSSPNHAIAFVACSLVAEQRTSARALRYSRSQSNYSFHDAYQGDALMTYRKVVKAVDWLVGHGYAQGHKGLWWLKKQSVVWATPKLMERIGHLVDITERQGARLRDEIILRDRDGKSVGFTDTAEIRRMRQEMKHINASLASQQFFLDDAELHIPPAARIFNQTFRRGGRLYHQGSSYQQIPKEDRAKIHTVVDGEVSPTVELDFESLHLRLAYLRAGRKMPEGDLYEVEGFSRPLVKLATLVALNADGTEVGAITAFLADHDDLALDNGLYQLPPSKLRVAIKKLIAAIKRKHYRISEFFGTGVGAELMRTDSDIALKVLLGMIDKTGRCPLVLHDSFLVPECDAELLQDLMVKALTDAGRTPFKKTYQSNPPLLPIHLGKHTVDQGRLVPSKLLMERAYLHLRVDRRGVGLSPPGDDPKGLAESHRREPDEPKNAEEAHLGRELLASWHS